MNDEHKMTPSLENYLEMILFLQEKNSAVRVTDVAAELNISKPSVNKAMNILKRDGYVNHEHYGLLSLTDEGLKKAKDIALRHFTIKRFLTDVLGIDPRLAEEEACMLEHSMSESTVLRLKEFLDNYKNAE